MKTKNLVLGCLMLGLSFTSVFAGDKGGNGGDGIICGEKVYMLDYVEMTKRGLTLDLPGQSIREKVNAVTDRVKKIDSVRGNLLSVYAKELISDIEKKEAGETAFKDIDFTTDVLSDVPDSLETTIPRGCVKEQLVTQKEATFPEDKRYTISETLFDKMDSDQKALMVLHESWYRMFLADKAEDSRFARYINGIFASKEKSKMDMIEYFKLLHLSTKLGNFKTEYKIGFQGQLVTVNFLSVYFKPGRTYRDFNSADYRLPEYDANGNITLALSGSARNIRIGENTYPNVGFEQVVFNKDNKIVSIQTRVICDLEVQTIIKVHNVVMKKLFMGAIIKFDEAGSMQEFKGDVDALYEDNKLIKRANGIFRSYLTVNLKVEDNRVYYTID